MAGAAQLRLWLAHPKGALLKARRRVHAGRSQDKTEALGAYLVAAHEAFDRAEGCEAKATGHREAKETVGMAVARVMPGAPGSW